MPFRQIIVSSPAHIAVGHHQLIINTDCPHTIPIEDISTLLLEHRQTTITQAALAALGESGCAVFVCDDKHLPCAVTMPFSQHCRTTAVLHRQLAAKEPLKKRLWQQIVIAKIHNQALCLRLCGKSSAADHLDALAKTVHSGDSGNIEAIAAAEYFPALFGKGFTRHADHFINASLNYGYAILRGCMARYLAVHGFTAALGLHHHNDLNAWNLADDMMEPYRPLIDLLIATAFSEENGELFPRHKQLLVNTLNLDMIVEGKRYAAAYAMDLLVQSLSRSLSDETPLLQTPVLTELQQHRYE